MLMILGPLLSLWHGKSLLFKPQMMDMKLTTCFVSIMMRPWRNEWSCQPSQESVSKAQNLFNLNLNTEIQFNATGTAWHDPALLPEKFQKALLRLHKRILVHDRELPLLRIVRHTHMTTLINCHFHRRHDLIVKAWLLNWAVSNPKMTWPEPKWLIVRTESSELDP